MNIEKLEFQILKNIQIPSEIEQIIYAICKSDVKYNDCTIGLSKSPRFLNTIFVNIFHKGLINVGITYKFDPLNKSSKIKSKVGDVVNRDLPITKVQLEKIKYWLDSIFLNDEEQNFKIRSAFLNVGEKSSSGLRY